MTLIKSTANNIYPPSVGNSLAVFVDIGDGQVKFKDQNGNTNTLSAYVNPSSEAGVIIEGTGLGSTLRCGLNNDTIAPCSVITGGQSNKVGASGCYGTISGGFTNSAYGIGSSVSGGTFNIAGIGQGGGGCCDCCIVGDGNSQPVADFLGIGLLIESCYSFVGGGCCNQSFGLASVVSGGAMNMATSSYSSVGGGVCNSSCSAYSYIGGGQCNTIRCMYGSILGGACNNVNHQFSSVVGCGITTTAGCTFFANNICATTDMYVGGLTSGCAVCVGANGRLTNSAGGGGGGVFELGSGVCSTQRSCVVNCAIGNYSGTLGGAFNSACGNYSGVINGNFNCTLGCFGTILNGCCNITNSSGYGTTILNGFCNVANGDYNIILNGRFNIATTASCALVGTGNTNTACNHFTTILNGFRNIASGEYATTLSGCYNSATGCLSTILNGRCNLTCGSGTFSTILNGCCNIASNQYALTGGGFRNRAEGCFSVVLNGDGNCSCGEQSTVLNGQGNIITSSAYNSLIASSRGSCIDGGGRNIILNGIFNTMRCASSISILGGGLNFITCGVFTTILNGNTNTINLSTAAGNRYATILGGCQNTTVSDYTAILNGFQNSISAGSRNSAILNGNVNTIASTNSTIIGSGNIIPAGFPSSYIIGDAITANRCCTLFANNLSLMALPASSAGLPSGSVWRCTADNTLRIVP